MNYNTVGDVGDLNGNNKAINNLVAGMRGLSKPFMQRIIDVCCLNVHDGTPETDINHLQTENPFESRYRCEPSGIYGKPCWEEEI